jgi:hypothetical protein
MIATPRLGMRTERSIQTVLELGDSSLRELPSAWKIQVDGLLAVNRIIDIRKLCTREELEKRYRADSPYAAAVLESRSG